MRNRIILLLLITLVNLYPQVREIETRTYFMRGDFNFNFASNIGVGFSNQTTKQIIQYTSPYDTTYSEYTFTSEGRPFIFLVTASFGYCIIDGLTIEPELDINLSGDEASISIAGNISYTFHVTKKKILPFVKIGYGISNYYGSDNYSGGYDSRSNAMDTKLINAGAGLRYLYSSGMALLFEINYRNYSSSHLDSNEDYYYKTTKESEFNMYSLSITIGTSIFF